MRCAAINSGSDFHLLDHLAPLAYLMKMPLLVEEEENAALARRYYPQVETLYLPDLEHRLGWLASEFDTLFECKYWKPHLKRLFWDLYRKEMRLIFCPHGQSDKGYKTPLLAPYAEQDAVLLYGQLLQKMLHELGIKVPSAMVGNFRRLFYLQHQSFYDHLAQQEVFSHLPLQQKTVLYAPTWNDADQSTSFFRWTQQLIEELPAHWNLILKIHPLLEQRDPARYYAIEKLTDRPNVLLVSKFPPVYPILARSDVYLGDYSSVGYDFLSFQRPMFFLLDPTLPKGRLHTCGKILNAPKDLFLAAEKREDFSDLQATLYRYAFAPLTREEARSNVLEFKNH